jgi:DNA-binding FadR family transcriptional regulator
MKKLLAPIRAKSLKEVFIERFESLILSGKLEAGQRLLSERELAEALGVSRPVVHEGLLELEARGLVTMKPRVGTVVNDYRTNGSLAILDTLVRLAALNRTEEHLKVFCRLLEEWDNIDLNDVAATTGLYFRFHHHLAMASGNLFYPLLLNSFKHVYVNISRQSFIDVPFMKQVTAFHRRIVEAIAAQDPPAAVETVRELIAYGVGHLKSLMNMGEREEAG